MNMLCEAEQLAELEPVQSYRYPMIAPIELPSAKEASHAEREMRMQRAQGAAMEAARQEGVREGEAKAKAAADESIERERVAVAQAIELFAGARREYFRHVEADVVKLAMAIARRVLRRECQLDPLLLGGVVRVALDQIQDGTKVVLRTGPSRQQAWREWIAAMPELATQVQVVGDEELTDGMLVLETACGTAEISLEGQLKEIENGFLDLLDRGEGESL
jgi:flagellar assembly protein FliH